LILNRTIQIDGFFLLKWLETVNLDLASRGSDDPLPIRGEFSIYKVSFSPSGKFLELFNVF